MVNKKRQEYNRMIIKIIAAAVENLPDQRFEQLLSNLNMEITSPTTESKDTFDYVLKSGVVRHINLGKEIEAIKVLYGKSK